MKNDFRLDITGYKTHTGNWVFETTDEEGSGVGWCDDLKELRAALIEEIDGMLSVL